MITKLTTDQKNLILGTLLGDASLQTFSNGRTWRYFAMQDAQQALYLRYKHQMLSNFCITPLTDETVTIRRGKKKTVFRKFHFATVEHSCFRFYGNLFYKKVGGKFMKIIPKNIEKFLNVQMLAYFYMDNGIFRGLGESKVIHISVTGFSHLSVKRLQKAIAKKFNFNLSLTKLRKNKIVVGYRFSLRGESNVEAFLEFLSPHIIPIMNYKIVGDAIYLL